MLDLFEGRRQLIVYHFMFPPGGEPCGGCSMFTDQVGHLAHLHARDTSFALVSPRAAGRDRAVQGADGLGGAVVLDGRRRLPGACGTDDGGFALQVFLRDGDRVFLTYETRGRGVEALGSVWTFLDLTPLGRQEDWEDTPPGRPQGPRYQWWDYHDAYGAEVSA